LISEAANTERPSSITSSLFIGGSLAARSAFTLQHLGITHILCLCSSEIGQSDSQYPELFKYKNFSVRALSILLYTNFWSIFLFILHPGRCSLPINSKKGGKKYFLVDLRAQDLMLADIIY
jgi:hypothetical protein